MAALGLMNKLDAAKYPGRFNRGFVKEFPNGNDIDYSIHPCLIALMKERSFAGDGPDEDPYTHLHSFIELCWTSKLRNNTDDELKLKLFSQSLTNNALSWYRTFPAEKIDTWENLKKDFIFRFYTKVKSAEARRDITNFKNHRGESLMREYLRFNTVQKCPHHDLPPWYVLHVFYGGLEQDNKRELDLLSSGSFM
jgi:hypothetical protein